MNESTNKKGVIVGVFILLGLVFLGAGILVIGNLHETFARKIRIVTILEDVNGLQKGNNIWFSGVKIGTVKDIEFFGKSEVKVIMKVNEEVQQYIRKDAKVKVGTDGLIGNKIIVIYGGTSRAAPIESGDTLAIEETFSTEDMMNTLQENNKNILDITNDLKVVSKKLASGEGSIGKILNDEDLHKNISAATYSLKRASGKAEELMNSFASFSAKLNKKGTLVNDLVTDTSTFHSLKSSISNLQKVTDTASVLMNDLRAAGSNSKTPAGVLLHDEEAGQQLKNTIRNLESGSKKLDEDLEAVRHNFLLRKYFRKKNKE